MRLLILTLCVALVTASLSREAIGIWKKIVRLEGWIDSFDARIGSYEELFVNVTKIIKVIDVNVTSIKTSLGLKESNGESDNGVVITDPTLIGNNQLRLSGLNRYRGRLEVLYNGQWGTVCDDDFTDWNAKVVCDYLNLPSENAEAIPRFGSGYGSGEGKPILLDNVVCPGTDIKYCLHNGWGVHDCSHDEDVGIHCR